MRGRPRTIDQRLVYEAVALRKQGKTQEEIATELGIVQGTVSTVLRAHGWGGPLVKPQRRRW